MESFAFVKCIHGVSRIYRYSHRTITMLKDEIKELPRALHSVNRRRKLPIRKFKRSFNHRDYLDYLVPKFF